MSAEAVTATSDRSFVIGALQRAAQATGADFDFLLNTATRESGLKPGAQAGTSSAVGLFQFIEQSWLGMVKNYGAKHGLGSLANAISRGSDGRYFTPNPADRSAILALRKDATVASLMGGEYAQASRAQLSGELGRDVCHGELYMAHFLGPDQACRLIRMAENQPNASAADAFPAAARANRPVFFNKDGSERTAKEVYNWALHRPNASAALRDVAPTKPVTIETKPVQYVDNSGPGAVNTDNLLMNFASWRPTKGFFSSDGQNDGTLPASSILLSPSVIDVLQSVGTAPDTKPADETEH